MLAVFRVAVVTLAVSCAASLATAQAVGPEFQVNTYTTGYQGNFYGGKHSVATDASGNFVVVWHSAGSSGNDSNGHSIQARRFNASGAPIGDEFQVNTYTTSSQVQPTVAAASNGAFVVAWHSYGSSGNDASADSIQARRFDASGNPIGDEFQVNTFTTSNQRGPSVAMTAAGGFVVAWQSSGSSGDASGDSILAQRFDASGNPIGGEFQVNAFTTSTQGSPSVAAADDGFVVAWDSDGSSGTDASGSSVQARLFDSSGNPIGGDIQVNTFTTSTQRKPSVAADATGRFVVAWVSYGSSGNDVSNDSIQARRFDASGNPIGDDFQVNTHTPSFQRWPSIAADASGSFAVAWISYGSSGNDDPSSYSIQARGFDSSGNAAGEELQVNVFTTSHQTSPSIAAGPGGRFVVAWMSYPQDLSSFGVFGRRLAFDEIFADGFESGDTSAWSAAATDGGDLSVSAAAALGGTAAGLQGVVDDTAALYVSDDSPADEDRYRARFLFDTNGFDPGEAQNHLRTRLFIAFEENPNRRLAAIVLRRRQGVYGIMGRARLDDNAQADTGFFTIADGPHTVELDWKRASGPAASDGTFQLWIDGTSVATLTGLDNAASAVDFARLGALSVKAGAAGTLYWDEFESRRASSIGP